VLFSLPPPSPSFCSQFDINYLRFIHFDNLAHFPPASIRLSRLWQHSSDKKTNPFIFYRYRVFTSPAPRSATACANLAQVGTHSAIYTRQEGTEAARDNTPSLLFFLGDIKSGGQEQPANQL